MEVATCRNCGRIFNHMRGQLLCPACQKELDGKFKEVKRYVYEHPHVGINELSKEMDVSVTQINRWIREERLCFSEDSAIGINCEKCGASIKTGRYCDRCKAEMANTFSEAAGLNRPAAKPDAMKKRSVESKMRFLDGNM